MEGLATTVPSISLSMTTSALSSSPNPLAATFIYSARPMEIQEKKKKKKKKAKRIYTWEFVVKTQQRKTTRPGCGARGKKPKTDKAPRTTFSIVETQRSKGCQRFVLDGGQSHETGKI